MILTRKVLYSKPRRFITLGRPSYRYPVHRLIIASTTTSQKASGTRLLSHIFEMEEDFVHGLTMAPVSIINSRKGMVSDASPLT